MGVASTIPSIAVRTRLRPLPMSLILGLIAILCMPTLKPLGIMVNKTACKTILAMDDNLPAVQNIDQYFIVDSAHPHGSCFNSAQDGDDYFLM